jgi:urease accessory protein UreF
LPTFLQSYLANLVTAAVGLIPLGQTDGQPAISELEDSVSAASAQAKNATIDDLGRVHGSISPPWRTKPIARGCFAYGSCW